MAKFPGPKLYSGSDLPTLYHLIKGTATFDRTKLHDRYGSVVRVSINELSYNNAQAWFDICGHDRGHDEMLKDSSDSLLEGFGATNIIDAKTADHARHRRLIAHAFSEKALREQEDMVKHYIDLFIQRLGERAVKTDAPGGPGTGVVDISAWFNFTTFDLIGDLTFGESFDCLENAKFHPWIAMMFQWLKVGVLLYVAQQFPTITNALAKLIPQKIKNGASSHAQLTKEKVDRRLELQTTRPDFMSYILRHNDERGMSVNEIKSNAHILIIGGSETTATLLSGATYYLLQNPAALQKLISEIRGAFGSEDEINYTRTQNLPYLSAVLNESLRIYPPLPQNLRRVVPQGGAMICGQWVPGGTAVSMNQWAAQHSPRNFKNPYQFVPERWTGDKEYADDDRHAWQPFSHGPRNCIGRNLAFMEMRLIMARLLWNFDLELMPDSEKWAQQKIYILWEKGPLNVRLRKVEREK